jgi:exopolysaccharide biosynthesis protein
MIMLTLVYYSLVIDRTKIELELDSNNQKLRTEPIPAEVGADSNEISGYFESKFSAIKNIPGLNITNLNLTEQNGGLEIIRVSSSNPVFNAYIATADLKSATVHLPNPVNIKTRPSDFGKQYNLDIVINGEAGETPGKEAPLGQWTGNYIVNGEVVMMEDNDRRPFMYFNREQKGYYSCGSCVVKSPEPEMYNAIWGRFDLIRDGKEAIDKRDFTKNNPYPRTVMGIDASGFRIFLMVVEGRRPGISMGLTMKQCADILLAAGAYHALACDLGGSSLMYSKKSGLVNRPADGGERAVYTHFGLRLKP